MDISKSDYSPRAAAKVAGWGYVAIFVLAIFANFFVLTPVMGAGDPAATANEIADGLGMFRAGLVSFLIVFVLDVAIAWALFIFFRGVGRDLSLLTAWFRLVYTVFLGIALVSFFLVLQLLSDEVVRRPFESGQVDAQITVLLDAFNYAWLIGLACFGVHLALLGYLVLRSVNVPSVIGVLLIAAGFAYALDTLSHAVLANYEDYEAIFTAIVTIPAVLGEMSLAIWLLLRGTRIEPLATRTERSAPTPVGARA